ncbi:hypothetical protein D3C86_867490 [compost metagenome]
MVAKSVKGRLSLAQHSLPLIGAGHLLWFPVIEASINHILGKSEFAHDGGRSAPQIV